MSSIRSLVLLKYEIITSSLDMRDLCETYPEEVRKNWAWRCALDVEHLAIGYKEAEHCIEVAKKYRDGLATMEELNSAYNAYNAANAVQAAYSAYNAARAAVQAAYSAYYAYNAAAHAARAAAYAARAPRSAAYAVAANATKWDQYIEWLIEELCIWEEKQ